MDKKQLIKTASLARLKLSSKEESKFSDQLKVVFDYFNQIATLDTQDTKPLVHPLDGIEQSETSPLRPDEAYKPEDKEIFLSLAPDRLGNEYKVPPVVE